MRSIKRGDIYYVENFRKTIGSEQKAGRPALIVSNDKNNEHADTVEIVFLTTQKKTWLPTHVPISCTSRHSIVLCEQVTTVSKQKLGDYRGTLSEDEMARVNKALLVSLSLDMGDCEGSAPSQKTRKKRGKQLASKKKRS